MNARQVEPALPPGSQAGQRSGESRAWADVYQPQKEHVVCLHGVSVTVKARLCHHRLCTDDEGAEEQCRDDGDIFVLQRVSKACARLHSRKVLLYAQPPATMRHPVFTCQPTDLQESPVPAPDPRGTAFTGDIGCLCVLDLFWGACSREKAQLFRELAAALQAERASSRVACRQSHLPRVRGAASSSTRSSSRPGVATTMWGCLPRASTCTHR